MVEIFPRGKIHVRNENNQSAPMSFNPDMAMTAFYPATAHPNCARMRTRSPMSANPNPTATPFPTAANPNKGWIGSDGNDFDLRRRGFARLIHDHFGIRRRLSIGRTVAINDLAFHAASEKR